MSADLALRGFRVTMYEMPKFRENVKKLFETGTIKLKA